MKIIKSLGMLLLVLALGGFIDLAGGIEWGTSAAGGVAVVSVIVGLIFFAVGVCDE